MDTKTKVPSMATVKVVDKDVDDIIKSSNLFSKIGTTTIQDANFYLDTNFSLFPQVVKKSQKQSIARPVFSKKEEIGNTVEIAVGKKQEQVRVEIKPLPLRLEPIKIKTSNKKSENDFIEFNKILFYLKEQGYKKIEIDIETGKCNFIN